jgi:hypothetical protein
MPKLPEKFPEYSLLYKTLTKRINQLEVKMKTSKLENIATMQKSIENYELEKQKIRKMFPENFFDDLDDQIRGFRI